MLNDDILKDYKSYYEKYMNIVLSMGANIERIEKNIINVILW